MTAATLDTLAASIEAALAPLLIANGGTTFKLVDHWAGDLSAGAAAENITAQVLNQAPAALIALEREAAEDALVMVTGEGETKATSTWSIILVATGAGQTARRAQVAHTGVLAAYQLLEPVIGALNGLCIAPTAGGDAIDENGLTDVERLRYVGVRWFASARGKLYALAARFTAEREAAQATTPDASVDYLGTTAGVTLEDTDDAVPATLVPFLTFEDS